MMDKRIKFYLSIIPVIIVSGSLFYFPVHGLLHLPMNVLTDYGLNSYTKFDNRTIVVYPIFTQYAYSQNGFYDYYHQRCDQKCLNVQIYQNGTNFIKIKTDVDSVYWINPTSATSINGYNLLTKLNYHFITDIDIDKNPDILKNYNKIILLHNEYVTEKEYNALSKQPKIIYLYPNALYAKINVNYQTNKMTLLYGHGYPNQKVGNAFNSGTHAEGEFNHDCKNMFWYKLHNGIELSCYPENTTNINEMLLKMNTKN